MSKESREAFAKAEADLKISRQKMAEVNAARMAEMDAARPEPSIEAIQRAMGLLPSEPKPMPKPVKEVDGADDKVEKISAPEKPTGSTYKTRDMAAKK